MQFKIENLLFKEYIKILDSTSEENIIEVNKTGWHARFSDAANICMINAILKKSAFEDYIIKDDTSYIAFNFRNILYILNQVKNDKIIDIRIENGYIKIISFEMEYKEKLLDDNIFSKPQENEIPNIDFKGVIILNSHFLKEKLRALNKISNYIIFEIKKATEEFIVRNGCEIESNECELIFKADKDNYIINILKSEEDSKSCYNYSEYLKYFINALKDYQDIILCLSNNAPLKITYKNDYETLIVDYYLAPRI